MGVADRYWFVGAAAREARIPGLAASLIELFAGWDSALPRLRRLARAIERGTVSRRHSVDAKLAKLQTPLQFPRKAYCVGANYRDHLEEMNAAHLIKKEPGAAPFFFLRPPSTSIVGPGKTVHIPPGCANFDWEAEMVVVFGKGGRNIRPERALDHVAGYTLGIDFTARDLLVQPEFFFKFNFALGKCQDTTSPIGPTIVPKEFVDGSDFTFSLSVNGVRKQSTSTKAMIYSLPEQIAGVSQAIRIEAGDVMFTGSPAGVGAPRGERLKPGDRIVVESAAIGAMEVVIQPPQIAKFPLPARR
jgi:2-keto-4-pentenoate hydratase/2-oxohepta-3-ene-1,7-dioic acid hydratase in catechol pathway